ncbi:MAG: DJ-1/PfpI family protein [Terrimicrobiaceae bacterium]
MVKTASDSLVIGGIIFSGLDQADFTGPYEVLSRLPGAEFFVIGRDCSPVRDAKGLILTPDISFNEAPPLDVVLVPGGSGVNALMEDEVTLDFLRKQAAGASLVLSVCTGALLLGAAGLLKGRRATTHWASHHLLPWFGAIPVNERVVMDGNVLTTAGVTSGIDGALRAAAILRGDHVAQGIQLYMEYDPRPLFASGSPESAPAEVLAEVKAALESVLVERTEVSRRVAVRLGISG